MNVKAPDGAMIDALKLLWEETFNDPREYIDEVIFSKKVTHENTLCLVENGSILAVTYMPEFIFSFYGETVPIGYVMGVATKKSERGRGLMGNLMNASLEKMYDDGFMFSALIPAEDWLYDYYSRFSYTEAFYRKKEAVSVFAENRDTDVFICEHTSLDTQKIHEIYDEYYKDKDFCIKKTESDMAAVAADHYLGGGVVISSYHGDKPTGLAFPINNGGCTIKELLYKDTASKDALISYTAKKYNANVVDIISRPQRKDSPGAYRKGMLRIIRLFDALCIYAKNNKDTNLVIEAVDPAIAGNCGAYRLAGGNCEKLSKIPRGAVKMDMLELTRMVLSENVCYMNLMLD